MRDRAARPPIDPRLLRVDRAVPGLLGGLGLFALVTAAALVVQSAAVAAIIARTFLDGADLADLTPWLVALSGAILVRAGTTWGRDVVSQRTAARVKSRLRRRALIAVTDGPHDAAAPPPGEVAALLTDGIDALDGTFGGYLPALVAGAVIPPVLLLAVLRADTASAVVLAVTLPLIPLFMVLIGLAARAATRRRFAALTRLSGHLLAVLDGATTVRVTRAFQRIEGEVRRSAERLRATTLQTLRVAFLSALALELLAALGVATVAVIAGVRLAQGTAAFEPVLFALLLAPEAFLPLRQVGQQFHANEDGAAAAERVLDLIERPGSASVSEDPTEVGAPSVTPDGSSGPAPVTDDELGGPARVTDDELGGPAPVTDDELGGPAPVTDDEAGGAAPVPVCLEAVTVDYDGRTDPALADVSLTLQAGETVAVLGTSGAGKTTLAAVLLGLRDPDAGRVVHGADPRDAERSLPGQVAWVPQAPAELRGTVRDLTALGAGDVDDAAIREALDEVGLTREVEALPDGLDTLLGPGARGLSVGQRRRLALARALLRPAGLVVLDEPTGDLDVEGERLVRAAVARQRGSRTIVICTHRVAVAAEADRVIVLAAGRTVEDGPPDVLAAAAGPYARLVAAARPLAPSDVAAARPLAPSDVAAARPLVPSDVAAPRTSARPGVDVRHREPAAVEPDLGSGTAGWWRELLHPHRRSLAIAVVAGTITPLAGVGLVALSTYLIARAALQPNILDLTVAVAGVRGLSILKGVSRYVERLAGHDVALRVVTALRLAAFRRLIPQAPAGLRRHRGGDVLTRLVADVERLQLALVRAIVPSLGGLLAAAAMVVAAALLVPAAAPITAVGLLTAAVVVPWFAGSLARRPERRLAAARGALTAELVEVLAAAPELRLLGRLDRARASLDARDAEVVRHDRSVVVRGGGADALLQATLGVTLLGLVAVGVPAVTDGSLAGTLLGPLLVLALAGTEAVGPLPPAARSLVSARRATARLREVLDAPPPAVEPLHPAPVPPNPDLRMTDAEARYPGEASAALTGVELAIAPGQRIAVIGRSGAGKSTLAALAVRFLDPAAGRVELGGVPATSLAGDDVRSVVTLAPQEAHLFGGTIADNLRLGRPEASDGQLWSALSAAQLDDWVASLPAGLATVVGDGGRSLSGGQRHRLVLARTLLVGGPLVVLDEPTADLDPLTGRRFLRDALAVGRERGVVLLTHDLRALPVVDEVVVLDAGRVVARGHHDQLLHDDPGYAAWWELERPDAPTVAYRPGDRGVHGPGRAP